jgi:acyl-coenzyme A synthetase/AMP-(fatty) acid ligase
MWRPGTAVSWRWLGKDGERRDLSYSDMQELAARFANVLWITASTPRATASSP